MSRVILILLIAQSVDATVGRQNETAKLVMKDKPETFYPTSTLMREYTRDTNLTGSNSTGITKTKLTTKYLPITTTSIQTTYPTEANSILHDPVHIICKPHEVIVEVDYPLFRYIPHVTKMFRCRGFEYGKSYKRARCEPVNDEDVEIQVYTKTLTRKTITTVRNHTSCRRTCVGNGSVCNEHETWNEHVCLCDCDVKEGEEPECGKNKVWSSSLCSCICPDLHHSCESSEVFNDETCDCRETEEIINDASRFRCSDGGDDGIIVTLIVIIVVLVITIFLMVCWWYKTYRVSKTIVENATEDENMVLNGNEKPDDLNA